MAEKRGSVQRVGFMLFFGLFFVIAFASFGVFAEESGLDDGDVILEEDAVEEEIIESPIEDLDEEIEVEEDILDVFSEEEVLEDFVDEEEIGEDLEEEFYVALDEIFNSSDNEVSEDLEAEGNFSEEIVEVVSIEEGSDPIEDVSVEGLGSGGRNGGDNSEEEVVEYLDLDLIVEGEEEILEESDFGDSEREGITYVYYNGNRKEMETVIADSEPVEITKDESVSDENGWVKEVTIASDRHVENPVTVFTDVAETELEKIQIYWREGERYVDFEGYDENENGLIDRISWVVPHLSEQNFEIVIDFDGIDSVDDHEISIVVDEAPSSFVDTPSVSFDFSVFYFNTSQVSCNFSLRNIDGLVQTSRHVGESFDFDVHLENGAYIWNLGCFDVVNASVSSSINGSFSKQVNYSPTIDFEVSDSEVNEGESVTFSVNVTTPVLSDISYVLYTGNGPASFGSIVADTYTSFIFEEFDYVYDSFGEYEVNLQVRVNGVDSVESVRVFVLDPDSGEDTRAPEITLVDPNHDEVINNEEVVFVYRAEDEGKIENCTFSLYYYNESVFGTLVYETREDSPDNDEEIEVELIDFDEGEYSWDVGCYDNSSNYRERSRDFSIRFDGGVFKQGVQQAEIESLEFSSEEVREIESLIESINAFLVEEERYSQEQKEAVADLGIVENLKFYKKKLLQMKVDLGHNLDYIRGDDKREERRSEILRELEDIRKDIPVTVSVFDTHEYFKNSLDFDNEKTIQAYVDAKGLVLDSGRVRVMARENEKIQNYIAVTAGVKQLEVEYLDEMKKLTLVTKRVEIKNESFDSLLEVVPEEVVGSVVFVSDHTMIDEGIFEIRKEDLQDGMIVYYVEDIFEASDFEKTTTLAFVENVPENTLGSISGFVTFVGEGSLGFWFYASWVFVAIGVAALFVVVPRRIRVRNWKRNPETCDLFICVAATRKALHEGDLVRAKERYQKACEIYPTVSKKCKSHLYKKIGKLQLEIDKRDARVLIKEFLEAAQQGRRDDALAVYDTISTIYGRMPKKYKQKVYNKVMPLVRSWEKD